MCGICGFIDYHYHGDADILARMVSTMNHRGPDDKGQDVYPSGPATVGIGHTRLSVIDLSFAGHQPMSYRNLTISYNGEIYNFRELKKELTFLGHSFISESDTEVVLHAFEEWGDSFVSKLIGMFALMIFNKENLEITFARDRAGIKPLYYYWDDRLFLFASELKAFYQHPAFQKSINPRSIHQYFDYGYIPSPDCIFYNCSKLEPGHILKFDIRKKKITIKKYWDVRDYYCLPDLNISYTEAKEELEKILHSAFDYRMVSDVPVGIFLSGGFDSTAVTSMLQSKRTKKLKTFTIGFEEGNNEAPFAREIAAFIGTDHTEYYCTTREAQDIISNLPFFYDEPFADSSAIPTILVSILAKKSVTVALSADAGDEIFAGYNNYTTYLKNLSFIHKVPSFTKKLLNHLTKAGTRIFTNGFFNHKLCVLSVLLNTRKENIPQRLLKSYYSLNSNDRDNLFKNKALQHHSVYDEDFSGFKDVLSAALATDYLMYLQNDILTKVDRATMSVSLEGREPFLDHRVVEFAARLPSKFKYGQTQKMILKDIVYKYVPKNLMDRPKSGFSIPILSWFRNDLSYLIEDNLNASAVAKTELFNYPYVQQLKKQFFNGKTTDPSIIWKLIQFQMWYKMWLN